MAATSPIRVDDDVYDSARQAGATMTRSAAQQITHWARLGRELEADPNISTVAVRAVLDGTANYDELDSREQALVRTEWHHRANARLRDPDLPDAVNDRAWAELDDDGNVVVHRRGSE